MKNSSFLLRYARKGVQQKLGKRKLLAGVLYSCIVQPAVGTEPRPFHERPIPVAHWDGVSPEH